jgi:hypothetical protein
MAAHSVEFVRVFFGQLLLVQDDDWVVSANAMVGVYDTQGKKVSAWPLDTVV